MPTYEFKCHRDGTLLEVVARFYEIDDINPACEICGKAMGRVFNPAGVVFKGTGFYRTDSRPKRKAMNEASSKTTSD